MMRTAWLVHGFNVSDLGGRTIDLVGPWLRNCGWKVGQVDYGWKFLLGVWVGNPKEARNFAKVVSPGDIALGHSNGCSIIHRATVDYDAPLDKVVYINPALDTDAAPGPQVREAHVFYAPDDMAVLAARFIPSVLWGSMGRDGYTGIDLRMWNHNLHQLLQTDSVGHSGAFKHMGKLGPKITFLVGHGGASSAQVDV